ncbi:MULTISPECIES: hypothetical protein [Mycobacteroides]|jgi:hypothetical protein|nr:MULTISPECIES: hypothetical protein [Mycobacteroides]MDM2174757.1 hypothetical protein [Mycobacteroides abscessus]MDM2179171.1 hypothetical protein [Mycobacteroides abscessus]MDM2205559.1 hypothetical protein [Mycobacteroides abscessus]MDM2212751.1 hypothetical protein [Mycobacteroides abscessus]MDM2214835.1 hypothetical protein [Mycobacteroides abscessus]
MSAQDQSIGQELVRIIRAEIRAYDERKDKALHLRRIADEASVMADEAAKDARDSVPGPLAGLTGDVNAQVIDSLLRRQGKPHVDFTMGGNNKLDRGVVQQAEVAAAAAKAANDELLRNQKQSAERTTAWTPRGTGENPPRRRWWQRKKR